MSSTDPVPEDYNVLKLRLEEAENTLEAIRAGEVDAVVVDGPSGQRVYTLESPDQPFRIFVEQMQEGALTLNIDGTILYCNRFFADRVGLPIEQVRGRAVDQFVALGETTVRELLASATVPSELNDCILRHQSEAPIPVLLAINPLPQSDMKTFGMVVTDLTERERAKKLEAEREAAEEANAARDQFLAVVSHELRTPLNAMLGWTQLLRRHDDCSPAVKHGLEVIERNAWTQTQLIEDLLDVSRVLAGKLRLELEPVGLTQAIEASVATVLPSATEKQIQIVTEMAAGDFVVQGDVDRLQQMVTNLLSNAVKFTAANGEVRVSLRKADGCAQIQVQDNGMGIPAQFISRLFGFYQQIEGSTTRRKGGLGLGLAIVHELTQMHGGRIFAESEGEGKGSTFTLMLPLFAGEEAAPDALRIAPVMNTMPLSGVRVLLVEDDDAAREILSHALTQFAATVTAVANAGEALAILRDQPFDALICDIGLPGMDGFELIRRIRAGDHAAQLPAVAVTAFASREDRRQSLQAGFQEHLAKPVDQVELCSVIANLTGK